MKLSHRASLGKKQGGERNMGGVGSILEVKATSKGLQERRDSAVARHTRR